jgi:hypothetical protein
MVTPFYGWGVPNGRGRDEHSARKALNPLSIRFVSQSAGHLVSAMQVTSGSWFPTRDDVAHNGQ